MQNFLGQINVYHGKCANGPENERILKDAVSRISYLRTINRMKGVEEHSSDKLRLKNNSNRT